MSTRRRLTASDSASRWLARRSAVVARIARSVLTIAAIVITAANPASVAIAARCFRASLRSRYVADGGHASTGSSCRWCSMSRANPLAVS